MRERRFHARGRYRIQGSIAWAVGLLLLMAVSALWGRWSSNGTILNLLGAVVCAASAAALFWLGWQFVQPLSLVLSEEGGRLLRMGRVLHSWRWQEASHVAWISATQGRFAIPEPYLVLKGYDEAAADRSRYMVPLAPFSETAYAVVRERLLMHGW